MIFSARQNVRVIDLTRSFSAFSQITKPKLDKPNQPTRPNPFHRSLTRRSFLPTHKPRIHTIHVRLDNTELLAQRNV